MPALFRLRHGRADTAERGYVPPRGIKPFPYTDIEDGARRLLIAFCLPNDAETRIYDCDGDTDFRALHWQAMEGSAFEDEHLVKTLMDRKIHVQSVLTDRGACRMLIEHHNVASPN